MNWVRRPRSHPERAFLRAVPGSSGWQAEQKWNSANSLEVNERIREAAQQAATVDGLSVPVVERFLRTGDETWDGAGSGRFTLAQFKEDEAYTRAAKAGLRTLLHLLATSSAEAQSAPQVAPDMIRRRIEPMVKGLVHRMTGRKLHCARIVARTFISEFPGGNGHRRRIVDVFHGLGVADSWSCSGSWAQARKMLR